MKELVVTTEGQLMDARYDKFRLNVTKETIKGVNVFEHRTKTNKDGSPLRVRRSGKTQTWKTRPEDFRVPVKYGMYESTYITRENAYQWYIPS